MTDFYYKPDSSSGSQNEVHFYKNVTKDLGLPMLVDLIVCNPPWIEASLVQNEISPLDNGVYDPESVFLKSALNFARLHLRKDGGQMLVLYSDLNY